jgi:hypothetical protein
MLQVLMAGVALMGAAVFMATQPTMAAEHAAQMSDSSKWSATTYAAASTAEHRKVLASGKRVQVTGEIIDVSCYLELGKHGAGHESCAAKCAGNGQPIGLLTRANTVYFLFPEEHHPRRDGQAEIKTAMIPLMGKTVTLSGTATMVRGSRGLFLNSADLANVKTVGDAH